MRLVVACCFSILMVGCAQDRSPSGPQTTPALRGAAPLPQITWGPSHLGVWGPHVRFDWAADPTADSYEWAFTSLAEHFADTGNPFPSIPELIAWLANATVRPGTTFPMWIGTTDLTIELANVVESPPGDKYVFAVRSVYPGADPAPSGVPTNIRAFTVSQSIAGPSITIASNVGACRGIFSAQTTLTLFAPALRFRWETTPGGSQLPIAMTEWKIDDAEWTVSGNNAYPEDELDRWTPEVGSHTFSVRATDIANYQRVLEIDLDVVEARGRGILVVQDTDPDDLVQDGIVPPVFEILEAAAVDVWLSSHAYRLHSTGGVTPPPAEQLASSSTMIWLLGTDAFSGGQNCVLSSALQGSTFLPTLASWQAAGGNLILCGFQPSSALRYTMDANNCSVQFLTNYPIRFTFTETDPSLLRHLALDALGLGEVGGSFRNTNFEDPSLRLSEATSQLTGYPDLHFDPLRWPSGPVVQGFGYYDVDLVPYSDAVVLYRRNGGPGAIAVADWNGRGRTGSTVYLGFHPYFMNDSDVIELFDRILDDFGELRVETRRGP